MVLLVSNPVCISECIPPSCCRMQLQCTYTLSLYPAMLIHHVIIYSLLRPTPQTCYIHLVVYSLVVYDLVTLIHCIIYLYCGLLVLDRLYCNVTLNHSGARSQVMIETDVITFSGPLKSFVLACLK